MVLGHLYATRFLHGSLRRLFFLLSFFDLFNSRGVGKWLFCSTNSLLVTFKSFLIIYRSFAHMHICIYAHSLAERPGVRLGVRPSVRPSARLSTRPSTVLKHIPSKGHSSGPREVMKVSPNMVKGIPLSLLGRGFPMHLDDFWKKWIFQALKGNGGS